MCKKPPGSNHNSTEDFILRETKRCLILRTIFTWSKINERKFYKINDWLAYSFPLDNLTVQNTQRCLFVFLPGVSTQKGKFGVTTVKTRPSPFQG